MRNLTQITPARKCVFDVEVLEDDTDLSFFHNCGFYEEEEEDALDYQQELEYRDGIAARLVDRRTMP